MADHKYGKFSSWEIINEDIARKTCDKTFFFAKESGVPQTIRWFFRAELRSGSQSQSEISTFFYVAGEKYSLFYIQGGEVVNSECPTEVTVIKANQIEASADHHTKQAPSL